MSTMNVSLPESLRAYVQDRVEAGHYGTSSEYVRDLIRKDQMRHELQRQILEGLHSATAGKIDRAYWATKRKRIGRKR